MNSISSGLFSYATVAQSVEQLIRNQQVAGSSPASSSKKQVSNGCLFFYYFPHLDGLEGGSRFAKAKRFALRSLDEDKRGGKGRR